MIPVELTVVLQILFRFKYVSVARENFVPCIYKLTVFKRADFLFGKPARRAVGKYYTLGGNLRNDRRRRSGNNRGYFRSRRSLGGSLCSACG